MGSHFFLKEFRWRSEFVTIQRVGLNSYDNFIFSGVVYSYSNGRPDILRHYNPYMHYTYGEDQYTIFEEDEKELEDFWSKSADEIPYVTFFPLYRFNLADYRVYSMDSFVDYVESLEGILVPDKNSISKKFQERGAYILSLEDEYNSIGSVSFLL